MTPYLDEATPCDLAALGVIDDVADAVVIIDGQHRLVAFNRAASQMFGYEPAEVLGKSLDVLLPEGASSHHRDHVTRFGSGPATKLTMHDRPTLAARHRDGREFPVDITIGKTRLGDRLLFNAVIRDATEKRREEAALSASIDRLTALTQHASEGVVIADGDGRIRYASPFVETLTGIRDGRLAGTTALDLLHPDDRDTVLSTLDALSENPGRSVEYEGRVRGAGGRWIWAEITTTNLLEDPRVGGFVTNFRDISHRRAADAQREAVAALGLRALRGTPLAALAHDAAELVVDLLGADAVAILEQERDDADSLVVQACVGWPQDFVGHRMPAPADSPSGRTLAQGTPVMITDYADEADFPTKDLIDAAGIRSSLGVMIEGERGPWGLIGVLSDQPGRFSAVDADFVQAVANVFASALERDRAQVELARQALHDPLTGLPNRALLNDRIELELARTHRSPDTGLVVHFIDLDNFKRLNDTLGHEAGDELLRQVAQRLRGAVREEDTVARFGGDEFVVVTRILPHSPSPLVSADRILTALRRPYDVRGSELFVTASIGVVISSHAHDSVESLLRDADAVMYEAKNLGRDRYAVFNKDLRAQLMKRAELERDLRSVLSSDELRVYYQPVVDSTTGRTTGLEALLRWVHPQRGLIPPGEFIPTAEDTGMILPIGRWVLHRACEDLAQFQQRHQRPDLGVSVNLSPRQLTDPALIQSVRAALAATGIAPSTLRLEITETTIVEDLARATSTLESISELGVGLVIDDFGTGYSSLTYLKQLPIICIKIDRSFVTDICADPADRAIVAAVSELTEKLGICAVAEGVETPAQLAAVRELGCTLIQGYHYSPALPAPELDAWLRCPLPATLAGPTARRG